jgi:hypothetical protein
LKIASLETDTEAEASPLITPAIRIESNIFTSHNPLQIQKEACKITALGETSMRVLGINYHKKYIEIVKSTVDQDWLTGELQRIAEYKPSDNPKNFRYNYTERLFHPLAYLIYTTQKQLKENNKTTQEIIKLSSLGEALYYLRETNTPGLDSQIEKLTSKDKKGYEKTEHEIQVASFYAREGYIVEFIKTKSCEGQRTPDLLIRKEIEIECKKVDTLSRRDEKNINCWRDIVKRSSVLMSKYKKNCSLLFKTKQDPDNETVKFITKELDKLLKKEKEGGYIFPKEGVSINLKYLTEFDKEYEGNIISYENPRDYYLEIDQETKIAPDGKTYMRNRREFRFKCEIPPDRVTRVTKAINTAVGQLSGEKPGLIYINLNHTDENMSDKDLEGIKWSISDRLRKNSTITAIVLMTENFIRNKDAIAYARIYKIIHNEHPKHKLPEDFKLIGE